MGMGMSVSPQIWQQFVDLVFQDDLIKHKQNFDVIVMILHYNTTLTPSSKAIYSGTKYYDTHIEFHSLFLDVSSTDV